MTTNSTPDVRPATQDEWLQMLARHAAPVEEAGVRRGDQRYPVDGMVTVTLIDAARPAAVTMPLIQASDSGMMVRSHGELPAEARVRLQVFLEDERIALRGRVMHCTDTIGGYKVGIQLEFAP